MFLTDFLDKIHAPQIIEQIFQYLDVLDLLRLYEISIIKRHKNLTNILTKTLINKLEIGNAGRGFTPPEAFQVQKYRDFNHNDCVNLWNLTGGFSEKNNDFFKWVVKMTVYKMNGGVSPKDYYDWYLMLLASGIIHNIEENSERHEFLINSGIAPLLPDEDEIQEYPFWMDARKVPVLTNFNKMMEEFLTSYPEPYSEKQLISFGKFLRKLHLSTENRLKHIKIQHADENDDKNNGGDEDKYLYLNISQMIDYCDSIGANFWRNPNFWRNRKDNIENSYEEDGKLTDSVIERYFSSKTDTKNKYDQFTSSEVTAKICGVNLGHIIFGLIIPENSNEMGARKMFENVVDKVIYDCYAVFTGDQKYRPRIDRMFIECIYFVGTLMNSVLKITRSESKSYDYIPKKFYPKLIDLAHFIFGSFFKHILMRNYDPMKFGKDHWFFDALDGQSVEICKIHLHRNQIRKDKRLCFLSELKTVQNKSKN